MMRTKTTIHWRRAGAPRALPALLAAVLVLGGCSATHVGDAWQCPVAQGAACASVAEADPAVKTPGKTGELVFPVSLEPPGQPNADDADRSGHACAGDCGPLAWVAKWLSTLEERPSGPVPVEPESISADEELPEVSGDGFRTEERIARIWIAPFVDSQGVYREGHWVRTVLEPSRWRLR